MTELVDTKEGFWKTRYTVVLMCFAATFVCYIDRVNISVAIIPMAEELNWDLETQGAILSSFYVGYLLMQVGGGFLAGGRNLGAGAPGGRGLAPGASGLPNAVRRPPGRLPPAAERHSTLRRGP